MDKQEFSRRVNAMMDRLYRISYGQLREEQDRMDAVQDALLRAWMNRHKLRRPEYFETWLVRILINCCHNRQRDQRRTVPLEAAPEAAVGDPPATPDFELRSAILSLPEKQRIVIILHYMEDYSVEETAKILKLPRETVRTRLRRARAALREQLERGEAP